MQDTWAMVYKDKIQNGTDLFIMLFTAFPEYKDHFKQFVDLSVEELKTHKKMKAHALTVMHALQSWVENLTDLDVLVELVRKNALRHEGRGLAKKQFHDLYAMMPRYLAEKLGDEWTPPVQEAWTAVVGVMSSVTDGAIDEEDPNKKF